jgi:hypothetical protein
MRRLNGATATRNPNFFAAAYLTAHSVTYIADNRAEQLDDSE